MPITIDASLCLINRTGAYYLARDIVEGLAREDVAVRYWRLGGTAPRPRALSTRIAARLMLAEIGLLADRSFLRIRRGGAAPQLFLDPLYVLRADLSAADIVLCHDVGPITHPFLYGDRTVESYRRAYARIAATRPAMVFVSDWTRAHFTALFGSDFPELVTIGLYPRAELLVGPATPPPGMAGPYFLTVGAFERRKNQRAALAAYRRGGFHERGVGYLLCGPRGDGAEAIVADIEATPGAARLGYVSDAELRWLYRNAEAFVLPSLLEGFGMPALEAAAAGLLPIVSQASALVEAVEGVCLETPPDDPDAMAAMMERALARPPAERAATSERLKGIARRANRASFLDAWRAMALRHMHPAGRDILPAVAPRVA